MLSELVPPPLATWERCTARYMRIASVRRRQWLLKRLINSASRLQRWLVAFRVNHLRLKPLISSLMAADGPTTTQATPCLSEGGRHLLRLLYSKDASVSGAAALNSERCAKSCALMITRDLCMENAFSLTKR